MSHERGQLEQMAHDEFQLHVGKTLVVNGFIFGYVGNDSREWHVNDVVVRVLPTDQSDIARWNDNWLDPVWNIEIVNRPDHMQDGRSFWIHGTSHNIDGSIEAISAKLQE